MKKTLFVSVLFALVLSAAFGQTSADEWYKKAGEYFESGDYANAIKAYGETIKRDSSNLNAYFLRGVAYFQTKNYDAAIVDCDTVIERAPDVPDAYMVRGDAYGAKGVYHKAIADYKTGLEKGDDPGSFRVDKSSKADMWFCGALFMEITVNRFLGNSVTNYENWLKTVCDNNKVSRAEVETFYRQNIGSLIAEVVDAEFKDTVLPPKEIQAVKDILTAFFARPNTATFNAVRDVMFIYTVTSIAMDGEKKKAYNYVIEAYDNTLRPLSFVLIGPIVTDVYSNFNFKSGADNVIALANMVRQYITQQ
jgi:tetratricopeptide (TPR) repeat protein